MSFSKSLLPGMSGHLDSSLISSVITRREQAVLYALSHDFSVKMIADALGISEHTVQDHIKNIKRKWNMHTSAGLVSRAIREGVIL